ncbi:pentatricopeptide repeat-containing protein At2g30100, chloroplastic-like [Aristolochia californica]|uniref:pentatricopeptide repeat-containing protein At2g30100, chloroplastic-like n=1 Tax=Aristolochia californica TaxID=171875 RepID=UPI0035E13CD3
MGTVHRFLSPAEFTRLPVSFPGRRLPVFSPAECSLSANSRVRRKTCFPGWYARNPRTKESRLFNSLELEQLLSAEESSISDGFFETIEELSRNLRDPADVLADHECLSLREIQLVLVYFSQEGRDSWCALEVFDWLRRGDRVDDETMELMVSIMCGWVEKLIAGDHGVDEVVDLLKDMDCVGLKPKFSMIEKVISLYWDIGKKTEAVLFVKNVLKKGLDYVDDRAGGTVGGPTGCLAWKMMVDGEHRGAVKLVIEFKESGLKPEVYSYLIAMTALVKELNELSKVLHKLKGLIKTGVVSELDKDDAGLIEKYQLDLLLDGVRLSEWAVQEGGSSLLGAVHERLLAMYTCAGQGIKAERHLWQMKLAGRQPDAELYDIVLAICACQKEMDAVRRLLARTEATNATQKKTLLWLLRGYVKGGHFEDASETILKMLDMGFHPEYVDRVAVLQGLRRSIQQSANLEAYLKLCKRLADAELIGPCLLYLYVSGLKVWIIRML